MSCWAPAACRCSPCSLARSAGCRVIATSSSDEKLGRARDLGADVGINYKTDADWDKEILRLTDGAGADCIVETGGVGTMQRSINALARHGKITLIGLLTGREGGVNPYPLMFKGGSIHGVYVGDRDMFVEMNRALTSDRHQAGHRSRVPVRPGD